MYIVRDKKTKKIIHTNPAPLIQNLGNKEVYYKFDPKKMEIGKTDGLLPEHFDINEKGEIVELTLNDLVKKGVVKIEKHQKIINNKIVDKSVSELVKEKLLKLQPNERIEKDKIVEKTVSEKVKEGIIKIDEPFEYVESGEIKKYSIKEVIEKKLLKTKIHCELAISMINSEIEQKIATKYSPGYEMKITKDYIDWMAESGSESDERAIAYRNMKSDIDSIKSQYADLKKQISEIKAK